MMINSRKLISVCRAIALLMIMTSTFYLNAQKRQQIDYVNPYIATAMKGDGGLALSVGPPFTMTNFSPQTSENRINRMYYVYEDTTIHGFIASHQPTVWMGDYGYVSVMPEIGKLKSKPIDRKLAFSHEDEQVSPYYYSVKMKAETGDQIQAEIAATERCGIIQFTFPEAKEAHLVVQSINVDDVQDTSWMIGVNAIDRRAQLKAFVQFDPIKKEITGYNPDNHCLHLGPELKNFKGYFVIQFDKDFTQFGTWNNEEVFPGLAQLEGQKRLGAYVSFSTKNKEKVKVKIATSFISIDQARENMQKEIPHWNLEKIAQQTRELWQDNLSKITVEGVSDEQKTIFYTAYYHSLLFPRLFSEYGRYYSAFDDQVHEGVSYTDFSLWDTFRALHPFLIFVQDERVSEMITAMLQMYVEGGRLPMWPNPMETNIMIGTHADAVIADAYVKGVRDYDINLAYNAMRKDAMMAPKSDNYRNRFSDRQEWTGYEAQAGLQFFHTLGYVPADLKAESVSRTIEYGVDDYCIAQVAKDLGKMDDYEKLMSWSKNYKNLYNEKTGFLSPRKYDGSWFPNRFDGFTEGSPWTYLFGAMHDVEGMIEMIGGAEQFVAKLDQNFEEDHYRHDNEPGHHYIYLYNYAGQPWKTQELVRKHTRENYRNTPDGINGNDDCGQMSAWYMFSVMGFYPVTPASGEYSIGAPQFPKITMNYAVKGERKKLEIVAKNLSEENMYVQSVTLDGKKLSKPVITHEQILNGTRLEFIMSNKPNYDWK